MMKQRYRKIIILTVFLVVLLNNPLGFNQISPEKRDNNSSEDYINLKLNGQEINITTPENKTYTGQMSGYFPGTWSFDNDNDATIPEGWVDNSQSGCIARVASDKVGHKKVVHLDDDSGNKIYLDNYFTAQTHGTIELWVLTEDASLGFDIRTDNGSINNIYLAIGSDKWRYVDNTNTMTNIPAFDGMYDPADNTWYHLTIHFRCNGAPSYMSLNENKFKVVVDGYDSGELDVKQAMDFINVFNFATPAAASIDSWVDAVGFSWDSNYNLGDNLEEGLLLSFDTNFSPDWLGYSLDEASNNTILGNTTIPFPSKGVHNIQVFGNSSIGERFESDIRYFSVKEINIITPENKTYTKPMRGYYPATYGFENDLYGSDPDGWTVTETGGIIDVISQEGGHENVLEIFKSSTTGDTGAIQTFTDNQSYGSVEFWWRISDASDRTDVAIYEPPGGGYAVVFSIQSDKFRRYYSPGFLWFDVGKAASDNTWYHIKIDFECTNGGYGGLTEEQWQVYIDGELFGPYPMVGTHNHTKLEYFRILNYRGYSGYSSFYDAVGYSWDADYNIGDNLKEGLLLSFANSTTLDWRGYSLNNQANRTILGNVTLPMLSPGHHTIQVFGNNTFGEMYESDLRHFSIKAFDIITPENKTYINPMSGYYPATYGFENDIVGENPQSWVCDETYGAIQIISELDNHNNVVEIDDDGALGWPGIIQYSNFPRTHGTIEFWVRFSSTSEWMQFASRDTADNLVPLRVSIEGGKWKYRNNAGTLLVVPNVADPIINKWTHIKIDFRCHNAPSYLGLSDDRFVITADGISSGELEHWASGKLDYNWFGITGAPDETMTIWVDAIGFSWDPNYDVGDNLNEGFLLRYDKSFTQDWMGYSLDNQANSTILGNKTIPLPLNGHHTIQVFGNNSIGEMFESDIRHFSVESISIDIITPENKTYTDPMSGYYPGTFGFENNVIGSVPENWEDGSEGTNSIEVVSQKLGHNNVLHLDDTGSGKVRGRTYFADQSYGTIELWVLAEDCDRGLGIHLLNNDTDVLFRTIQIEDNKWKTTDETTATIIPAFDGVYDPADNTWYQITLHFRGNSAPSYQGLGLNKFKVIIDGSYDSGELDAANSLDFVNKFVLKTRAVEGVDSWVDAVGYSWDPNYNIGDNLDEGLLLSYTNYSALEWMGYSLDNQVNKTLIGNTTIPFPSGGQHSIQVFGNSSLGFYYESDVRYFSIMIEDITIDLLTPENIIYTAPMSGYYPGTYGFEDEIIGTTGLDIGFLDTYEASSNCYTTIVSELGAHKNVLRLYDNNVGLGLRTQFFNYFGDKGSGSIEFWIRTTDATLASHVRVYSSTDQYMIQFKIEDDRIQTNDESSFVDLVTPAINNHWYHIRFDLETTTGGYQGLSQYEYYVYVDGFRYGSFGFQNDVTPYKLFMGTLGTDGGYSTYYDAIGYSWDQNYNIRDNVEEGLLLSFTNSSPLEWIGYSLDGQANKTITGNRVIPMPGNGLHSIQVHARSTLGHYYASSLVYFTVDISAPPPPPGDDNFMLIFILIGVFSIVGITIAIVVIKKVHTPSKVPRPRKPKVKKKGMIEEEVFCPFCGTLITPEHKFCTYCGSDLKEEEET